MYVPLFSYLSHALLFSRVDELKIYEKSVVVGGGSRNTIKKYEKYIRRLSNTLI